jgi:hypothetical protein
LERTTARYRIGGGKGEFCIGFSCLGKAMLFLFILSNSDRAGTLRYISPLTCSKFFVSRW